MDKEGALYVGLNPESALAVPVRLGTGSRVRKELPEFVRVGLLSLHLRVFPAERGPVLSSRRPFRTRPK